MGNISIGDYREKKPVCFVMRRLRSRIDRFVHRGLVFPQGDSVVELKRKYSTSDTCVVNLMPSSIDYLDLKSIALAIALMNILEERDKECESA